MSYNPNYPGYYGPDPHHAAVPYESSKPRPYGPEHMHGQGPYESSKPRPYGPEHMHGQDRGRNIDRRDERRVISSQPRAVARGYEGKREWSTDLFECTEDMTSCMCVLCCSPFYECYIMEKEFGESCLNGWCLGTAASFLALRYRFRDRHDIRGSLMGDCGTMTFCYACAVCQMKRENDRMREQGHEKIGDIHRY